ncbi:hypothetical protein HK405_010147, partial [Cladochytrium tenue]
CDGVRPTCGFCAVHPSTRPCLFLGTKSRIDPDLASKFRPDLAPLLAPAPTAAAFAASTSTGANQPFDPATVAAAVDSALARPGAAPDEQERISRRFFSRCMVPLSFIHKRSFSADLHANPPFLRMAVCAAGVTLQQTAGFDRPLAEWYNDRARALSVAALEVPSVANIQALLLLSCVSNSVSTLTHRPSFFAKAARIRPLCAEDVWWSMEDPVVLYPPPLMPVNLVTDNPLSYYVPLTELSLMTFDVAKPETVASTPDAELDARESIIDTLFNKWLDSLPPKFWVPLEEEWIARALERSNDPAIFQCLWLSIIYHGSLCLLMRRKSLLYLRGLGGGANPQPPAGRNDGLGLPAAAVLPAAPPIPSPHRRLALELAFNKAVDSALDLGRLVEIIVASARNVRIPLQDILPRHVLFFCIQGAMTATMALGVLRRNKTIRLLLPAAPTPPQLPAARGSRHATSTTTTCGPPSTTPRNDDLDVLLRARLDAYFALLADLSASYTLGTAMLAFLARLRDSDWDALVDISEADSGALLDSLGPPADCIHAAHHVDAPVPTKAAAQRRQFADLVRDFVVSVRLAREPPPTADTEDGGTALISCMPTASARGSALPVVSGGGDDPAAVCCDGRRSLNLDVPAFVHLSIDSAPPPAASPASSSSSSYSSSFSAPPTSHTASAAASLTSPPTSTTAPVSSSDALFEPARLQALTLLLEDLAYPPTADAVAAAGTTATPTTTTTTTSPPPPLFFFSPLPDNDPGPLVDWLMAADAISS